MNNIKKIHSVKSFSIKINKSLLITFLIICIVFLSIVCLNITATENSNQVFSEMTLGKNIIIDAGHGGFDPGAKAIDGKDEQLINLAVSKKLNVMLLFFGFDTTMTRTTEESIHSSDATTLREMKKTDMHKRLDISKEIENPIFISIHQNASPAKSAWGSVVYYSKNNPESHFLADYIQNNIIENLQKDNKRSVVGAGKNLYLLHNAICPAVLVECSFITNNNDYKKISDEEYQKKLIFLISKGVVDFLNNKEQQSINS